MTSHAAFYFLSFCTGFGNFTLLVFICAVFVVASESGVGLFSELGGACLRIQMSQMDANGTIQLSTAEADNENMVSAMSDYDISDDKDTSFESIQPVGNTTATSANLAAHVTSEDENMDNTGNRGAAADLLPQTANVSNPLALDVSEDSEYSVFSNDDYLLRNFVPAVYRKQITPTGSVVADAYDEILGEIFSDDPITAQRGASSAQSVAGPAQQMDLDTTDDYDEDEFLYLDPPPLTEHFIEQKLKNAPVYPIVQSVVEIGRNNKPLTPSVSNNRKRKKPTSKHVSPKSPAENDPSEADDESSDGTIYDYFENQFFSPKRYKDEEINYSHEVEVEIMSEQPQEPESSSGLVENVSEQAQPMAGGRESIESGAPEAVEDVNTIVKSTTPTDVVVKYASEGCKRQLEYPTPEDDDDGKMKGLLHTPKRLCMDCEDYTEDELIREMLMPSKKQLRVMKELLEKQMGGSAKSAPFCLDGVARVNLAKTFFPETELSRGMSDTGVIDHMYKNSPEAELENKQQLLKNLRQIELEMDIRLQTLSETMANARSSLSLVPGKPKRPEQLDLASRHIIESIPPDRLEYLKSLPVDVVISQISEIKQQIEKQRQMQAATQTPQQKDQRQKLVEEIEKVCANNRGHNTIVFQKVTDANDDAVTDCMDTSFMVFMIIRSAMDVLLLAEQTGGFKYKNNRPDYIARANKLLDFIGSEIKTRDT